MKTKAILGGIFPDFMGAETSVPKSSRCIAEGTTANARQGSHVRRWDSVYASELQNSDVDSAASKSFKYSTKEVTVRLMPALSDDDKGRSRNCRFGAVTGCGIPRRTCMGANLRALPEEIV